MHSVHRFVFSVPDIEEAERFYTAFGLRVVRNGRRIDLYTHGHAHRWGTVHDSRAPKKLEYIAYGVHEQDMPVLCERIERLGLGRAPHPWADEPGLWLNDVDGIATQLVIARKVSPNAKTARVSVRPPERGHGAAPSRSAVKQVRPRYLSHVLRFTPDVPRMVAFCRDVLGLRLSDHSRDLIAFMHGAHGSDHHLVAFAKSHGPGLHHTSWDVGSLDDVGIGSEQMRAHGFDRGWGVGRHVLGSNYFYYVRDPWGSYAEYSHDIDFVPAGFNWPAGDHDPVDSLYVWGPTLPDDFITNHEQHPAACRHEGTS
ncbi:VOC family protein [Methylibium sp.]|uniref:VOC family protein n=1 Tax=Methylibium sp. TaxID=2067992 RepID=UPI003D09FC69